jgi:hypothetical protein
MQIKVTNIGQSKMSCPLNRDSIWSLLPGQSVETYSDHHHLELLKKLAEHKVIVEVDGEIISKHKAVKKRSRRTNLVIDPDLRLLKRIMALKFGMTKLNSNLRKRIADLEFKLATIVPGKDVSAFMNLLVEKADSESKLGIFKRILKDNKDIQLALGDV